MDAERAVVGEDVAHLGTARTHARQVRRGDVTLGGDFGHGGERAITG
jgi:hypothetical protein